MIPAVSIQAKKHFLTWFLDHCALNYENTWVLNYLLQHDSLLNNVHFVSEVTQYPKGMMMTSQCSYERRDFRFHKKHIITNEIEKVFHDIRLHPKERLYVQLNFSQEKEQVYTSILEDQFFAHENKQVKQADQRRAEQLIQKVYHDVQKQKLRRHIDSALDHKDKTRFITLSNKWKHVMNKY